MAISEDIFGCHNLKRHDAWCLEYTDHAWSKTIARAFHGHSGHQVKPWKSCHMNCQYCVYPSHISVCGEVLPRNWHSLQNSPKTWERHPCRAPISFTYIYGLQHMCSGLSLKVYKVTNSTERLRHRTCDSQKDPQISHVLTQLS